jgi:hypothetical protein
VSAPEELDRQDVLERIAALPISSWSYIGDDRSVRHIGPMAQDFYAAFGLGADDKRIDLSDVQGVALLGIQALHERVRRQQAEIGELRERIDRLARTDRGG